MNQNRNLAKKKLSEELLSAREKLFSGKSNPELLSAIKTQFPDLSNKVFIIGWIPEQAEDIFTVLVDADKIVEVEISRVDTARNPIEIKVLSLLEYLRQNPKLAKTTRRKIDMAVSLSIDD